PLRPSTHLHRPDPRQRRHHRPAPTGETTESRHRPPRRPDRHRPPTRGQLCPTHTLRQVRPRIGLPRPGHRTVRHPPPSTPPNHEGTALSTAHAQADASTDRHTQVGTPDSPAPSTSDPVEPGLPSPGTGAGVPARWCMTVGQIGGRRTQVRVTVPLSVLLPP